MIKTKDKRGDKIHSRKCNEVITYGKEKRRVIFSLRQRSRRQRSICDNSLNNTPVKRAQSCDLDNTPVKRVKLYSPLIRFLVIYLGSKLWTSGKESTSLCVYACVCEYCGS